MVGEAPREPQANATGVTNRIPFRVQPMLATLAAKPFDRAGWVFEEKYDGDRILAYKEGDRVRLLSRNGKDRTDRFPRIAATMGLTRFCGHLSVYREGVSNGEQRNEVSSGVSQANGRIGLGGPQIWGPVQGVWSNGLDDPKMGQASRARC